MTKQIFVLGLVQGVGFRPYVLRLAQEAKVSGYVKNKGAMVEILAQGEKAALENFSQRLACCLPQGAEIWNVQEIAVDKADVYSDFIISESSKGDDNLPLALPDISTCEKCSAELMDKQNRRYKHPFISCTVCGPRYSVLHSLPYDRCNTVMHKFPLCNSCGEEYNKAEDIRCYAQTICCNECGPELFYTKAGNPVDNAVKDLKNGKVIAIKDIGGFHFACDADNEAAVRQLRELKLREKKPFAVMFRDIEAAAEFAYINDKEKALLLSSVRPIVLLKKKKDFSDSVCGSSADIGAFLPSNPIQIMLMAECPRLVMTSGNLSGEPIITDNETVLQLVKYNPFLDGALYHNRDILTPLDDSITRVLAGRVQITRRARGYVPLPIALSVSASKDIFAAGGDLKAAFCFVKGGFAYMSQYFGDLENEKAFSEYKANIEHMKSVLGFKPDMFAADKHPEYYSADVFKADITFQHHHAHIASVIAEHNLKGKVLGFAFDGTGYGTDGSVWGSEVFICENDKYERAEHLSPVVFFGGNSIATDAEKAKNCYLYALGKNEDAMVKAAIENKIGTFESTSMGRLFDAVCARLGICTENSFEGECAIALEKAAGKAENAYPLSLADWNWKPLLCDIINAQNNGASPNELALGFHFAVAEEILQTAKKYKIKQIALSGGVFANRILTEKSIELLEADGFQVYINEKVPANDGGIALGQAYLASLIGGR